MAGVDLEICVFNNETYHIDLNDVLDIVPQNIKGNYIIVYNNGEAWYNVKLKKSVYNKFERLKKKRGQIDGK